jgi:hypothetical protein
LLDHLQGAAAVIVSQRPIVTLYPAGHDRATLLSLFSDFEYTVTDLHLRPILDTGGTSLPAFGWIAVPNEREGASISQAEAENEAFDPDFRAGQTAYSEALPRQRRIGSVFGLGVDETPNMTYRISASEMICCGDCYPFEADGQRSWRWLGPRSCAKIAVPCPLPGRYSLEVVAIGASAPERLAECRVLAEGSEVRASATKAAEGKLNLVAHLNWAHYAGYLELELIIFGCRPPSGADRRTLRLCVESIAVSSCN